MARRGVFLVALVIGCLAVFGLPSLAQDGLPQPISITGNSIGEVTVAGPARFVLASAGNESAQIQVFGVSETFAPRLRVLDASGAAILEIGNPGGQNTISGTAFFIASGAYIIEISGEQGSTGQFVLSLQPGTPPPPTVELAAGQQLNEVVGQQTPLRVYEFVTTADAALTLDVLSELTNAGPVLSLFDVATGRVIATSDGTLLGVTHYLMAANARYRLEVQGGSAGSDIPFTICLGCSRGASQSSGDGTSSTAGGACRLTTGIGGPVNVRSGPGTNYLVIGGIQVGQSFTVTGQISGGGWYQIDYNSVLGWVGASVAALEGACVGLPVVAAPVGAPLAPPTITLTPLPSATPGSSDSSPTPTSDTSGTATATATEAATATPTATPSETVPPPASTPEV